MQYFKILFCFNTIVENLNLESNWLGGISSDKAVLITGMPSFFNLLRFPKAIPIQVIAALSNDIITKNLYPFSSYYKAKLKKWLYDSSVTFSRWLFYAAFLLKYSSGYPCFGNMLSYNRFLSSLR